MNILKHGIGVGYVVLAERAEWAWLLGEDEYDE